jgi:hypothetical protein
MGTDGPLMAIMRSLRAERRETNPNLSDVKRGIDTKRLFSSKSWTGCHHQQMDRSNGYESRKNLLRVVAVVVEVGLLESA